VRQSFVGCQIRPGHPSEEEHACNPRYNEGGARGQLRVDHHHWPRSQEPDIRCAAPNTWGHLLQATMPAERANSGQWRIYGSVGLRPRTLRSDGCPTPINPPSSGLLVG
jgi:hypothetical protein